MEKSEQPVARHEEAGYMGNYVSPALFQEPFLSFSTSTSYPVIRLKNALDQPGNNKNLKGSNIEDDINSPKSDTNGIMKKNRGGITMLKSDHSEIEKCTSILKNLPGWPLTQSSKISLQKCGKCSQEFCSMINYRRHIRIHRRSINRDKVCPKSREYLCQFFDKLSLDKKKELLSFTNVALEEVHGILIVNALALLIQKSWFSSLPQVYLKAGSILLNLIEDKPFTFPISSQDLFNVLDDASEKTFLCTGNAVDLGVKKFVFDLGVEKIAFDPKNVIACTSFILEEKLVKAWLADKEAEALRCEKLLMEEEEAAQKRQAQLLERKRQKKLRQKEHRSKEHSSGNKTSFNGNTSDIVELSGTEPSLDISIDITEKYFHSLNSMVEDTTCEFESGDQHMQHKSGQKETAVSPTPPLSKSTILTNSFQKIPTTTKSVPMKKTYMVWTEKNKTESSDKAELVTREGSNQCNNSEVLIGSIPVSVGNNYNLDIYVQGNITTERPFKPDALTLSNGGCHPSVKQWKPVNRQEGSRNPLALQKNSMKETKSIPAEQNSLHHGENGSINQDIVSALKVGDGGNPLELQKSSMKETKSIPSAERNSLHHGENRSIDQDVASALKVGDRDICSSTSQAFSSQIAMDFLKQRWKAAHSSEHVKIGMFPNSELLKNMEEVLQSLDCSCLDILGHPEEHMLMVDRYLDSALSNVYKSKIQPKNEKNYQIKYIPKQRNGMLER